MKEADWQARLFSAPAIASHTQPLRVRYGETDTMGVAYYGRYLEWFECGRGELMRQTGIPYTRVEEAGFFLPVREVHCRYLKSLRYDEPFRLTTELVVLDRYRAVFRNFIRTDAAPETVCTEGGTLHLCVNARGRVCSMPPFLLESFGLPSRAR